MKNLALILFAVISLISCTKRDETPVLEKPLEPQENVDSGIFKVKRGQDFVESIYSELVDKDPALKKLEEELQQLHKQDSTAAFSAYNDKSMIYYNDATNLANRIKDTILLKKMKALIDASAGKYDTHIASQKALLAGINTKTATLNDLHAIIKLTYTLPLIEQYQKDKLPADTPIKNYDAQLNKVLGYEESLLKK